VLFYNYSKAQPYESVFGQDTTQWNVIYLVPDLYPTFIYRAVGDTVIDDFNYKQLFLGTSDKLGNRFGYLREDTTIGKLWHLSISNKERLIMDLSLEKSDTFHFEGDFEYTVDTVFYRSGRKYISFNEGSEDSVLFIEGIGPFNFLHWVEVPFPEEAQIRCMFKDNVLIFKNSSYSNCYDTVTNVICEQLNTINIYPNPALNYISISSMENEVYSIEIFNTMGYLVFNESINNNKQINISSLTAGIYAIRINTKSKTELIKLIKL
jgi:hypothetical protein